MAEANCTYGEENTCTLEFGGKTLKKSDHLEDPGLCGRIMLK